MSRKQKTSTTPSNEPTALTPRQSDEVPVLSSIEERLNQADNTQDIVLWTQVRGEIMQQDEESRDREHQRSLEKKQVRYKTGFSVIFIVAGIGMFIYGFTEIGVFILGAGIFGVVPDYVKAFLRIFRKGGENAEE